jgi:hypothetical protein
MKKELAVFFMIGLMVNMPILFAAETSIKVSDAAPTFKPISEYDENSEYETGESIIVQVKSYEPTVLVASAIEQDDVPVFVYLAGTSLGSITGPEFVTNGRLTVVKQGDIFYGVPPIETVLIQERDFDNKYIKSITYRRPKNGIYSMDNLGYLVVNLKQIPVEKDVPDIIDANITARIKFDMERSYGIGRQTLILGEEADEKSFLKKIDLTSNMVFSGNAYVRAVKVSDDSADFMVYDTTLKSLGSRTSLKVGQISTPITLRGTYSNLVQDQFRLQVDSIVDPQREYTEAEVSVDGSIPEKKILYKGSTLYAGSGIKVDDLGKSISGTNTIETLKLRSSSGTYTALRNYTDQYNVLSAEIKKDKMDNFKGVTIKSWSDLGKIMKSENYNFQNLGTGSDFSTTFDWDALKTDSDNPNIKLSDKVTNLVGVLKELSIRPEVTLTEEGGKKIYLIKLFKGLQRSVTDVCSASDIIYDQNSYYGKKAKDVFDAYAKSIENADASSDAKASTTRSMRKRLLCSSIDALKKVSSTYTNEKDDNGILYSAKADYMVGKAYDELAALGGDINSNLAKGNALNYYNRAVKGGIKDDVLTSRVNSLSTSQVSGEERSDVAIDDNGRQVIVSLVKIVNKMGAQTDASAKISVNSKPAAVFYNGQSLFPGEPNDMDQCKIKEIRSTSVIIENCPVHESNGTIVKDRARPDITLKENVVQNIESYRVMLTGTELNKQVSITVLPGTGKPMYSETSFMLHIPVEKRAIKLNPDKIDDKINKTEETIKKLDSIITDLDKIIKSWKAVCLATFAFLTLKNSFGIFGGGSARVKAREQAMVDGGWRKYCEMDSGPGKTYKSYDECIFEHADKIEKNIDAIQKAYETADKNYKKGSDSAAGVDIKGIRDFQTASGEELYSEQNFKNLVYLKELNDACQGVGNFGNDAKGKTLPNACADVSRKYSDSLFEIQSANTNLGSAVNEFKSKKLDSFESWKKANEGGSLNDFLNARSTEVGKLKSESEFKTFVQRSYNSFSNNKTALPADIVKGSDNQNYWVTPYGTVPVISDSGPGDKTQTYYYKDSNGSLLRLEPQTTVDKKSVKVSSVIWNAGKTSGKAYNPDGSSFDVKADSKGQPVLQAGPFNGSIATTHTEVAMGDVVGMRQTYDAGATYECYEDGKPYCIPLSKGNFVKILEFYNDGSPKTMNVWNVGPDGKLCSSDDVPAVSDSKYGTCAHTSSLMTNQECSKTLAEVQSKVNSAMRYCKAKSILSSEDGHKFKHSISSAAQASSTKAGHCEDAMEISDCKLMFAVCDPVMCPPSRFNLAGNWPVDDVTKTGIIGSIVLGLPNFPTDPVPICLTGISAGLKNIRSIFQAYRDCLVTMKVEGKSVGICDKIRSVYLCQILWQEAIAIFKVKGGLLDVVGKMFGNSAGGGEYFSMSDNFANVEKSVNYFTQSYASSVFAAHKGKSLDEVGTEICKSAVYGKLPGFGEYFDHLTEPENPPQFTALFEEMPYSTATTYSSGSRSSGVSDATKSMYSVYYHIYAGTDQQVQYSVYLKSPTGRKLYVTEDCDKSNRRIEIGQFADYSITCVGDTGFTQVCVLINGKESCGFGKVTTEFSLNYLNDMVVKDEASRKITKVEDCVPDNPRTSPSLGSVALPGQVSLLRTGIVRVCSYDNPSKGANFKNWQVVGTCLDKDGKSWGNCWMDMSTVDIKHVSDRNDLQQELESKGIQVDAAKKGIPSSQLLKAEESKAKIVEAKTLIDAQSWSDYVKALAILQEVVDLSIDPQSIADATYKIGVIYYELAMMTPTVSDLKASTTVESPDIPKAESTSTTTSTPTVEKKPEVCYDKIDNDGDGLVDCADDDCDGKYAQECMEAKECINPLICNYERKSACRCIEGPCCNLDDCDFSPSTTVCLIGTEYECTMKQTGDEIYRKSTMKYCTGKSSSCDGQNVVGNLELFITCGIAEECRRGESSCFPISK